MTTQDQVLEQNLPLKSRWTLWYNGPRKKSSGAHNWEKRYKQVTSFDTVQDFWRIFNNLTVPSKLPAGSDYHLFKEDIEPEWEQPQHHGGGFWTFRAGNKDAEEQVDFIWFQLLLSLIGNTLDGAEHVTGIVCSRRRGANRIQVWTSKLDARSEDNMGIGKQFKAFVTQQTNKKLNYSPYDDKGRPQDKFDL